MMFLSKVQRYLNTSFISGNDQINYGYTDKGLGLSNSKDRINFSELGTQLAYIYRLLCQYLELFHQSTI